MRRRKNTVSYKSVFIFVFVVVLAAAIISTSNTSGALIIKRAGINAPTSIYKNVCVDPDARNINYSQLVTSTYIKQLVRGETHIIKTRQDACLNDITLEEAYCIGNRIYAKTIYCPQGCENGACSPCLNCEEILASCKDSDGGKLYFLTGVVTDETGNHKDVCNGRYVREGYCSDGKFAWEWKRCHGDCYNGACLKG